jgi:hypothetical protein
MQLNVDLIPNKAFSHFPKTKRLVAELNDLNGFEGFKPLYDDAVDVGLAIKNVKTGNITRWCVATEIRDHRNNELHGWYLVPTPEALRRNPVLEGYCMTLIND